MLRSLLLLSLASAACEAAPLLSSSVRHLSVPAADTTVSWSGVTGASTSDWVALFCSGGTYFYWVYASGAESGSVSVRLFANSAGSGCETLEFGYYSGNSVLMRTPVITVAPMIQQMRLSMTSNTSEMTVDFVSSAAGSAAACMYGDAPGALTRTARATTQHAPTIGNVSYAVLTGLKPGSRVYYSCTDGVATSAVSNFTAGANGGARVGVWADFGVNDGFGLDQIARDAEMGLFDMALHAGGKWMSACRVNMYSIKRIRTRHTSLSLPSMQIGPMISRRTIVPTETSS